MTKKLRLSSNNQQILKEYKDVVDIGSIVSKTDVYGIITFVNEKFCTIAGYSADELMGKPHNIIRHPDMPAEIFKEMWRTIQSGESWSGKVKNRKKNGEPYYVNTVINPIRDEEGKIIEYIAVRTEITDIVNLQIELDNTQKEIINKISELKEKDAVLAEQKRERQELILSEEKAKLASSAKSIFLANMSHEIRTPMNAILGFVNILLKNETSPEKISQLAIVQKSSNALMGIINDILDFSKIESGMLTIDKVPFITKEPFMMISELFYEKAQEKNITLNINFDDKLPFNGYGDTTRIKQVYCNLLSNAIKFSKDNSSVDIDILFNEQKYMIECCVKDSGIGIKPQNIEKIFTEFEQEDSSITRRFGGTGLGLSISKKLVELMGGKLEVVSEFNRGSKFSFYLDVFSDAPAIEEERELTLKPDEVVFKGRVLVVEDNKSNQLLMRLLLEDFGIDEIVFANDGLEGLEAYKNGKFSLILMDENMPNMNGIDATRHIRGVESKEHSATPIVAVTANALVEDKKRFLEAGMDDYITKPIVLSELQRVLSRFLKNDVAVHNHAPHTEPIIKHLISSTNRQILKEYKDVVDISSIVSKTDANGIITFVNDKFCAIAGYSADELIGKPHNIIRHPDMPAETFKEMWRTIQSGESWSGKVKNRKKNAEPYYVNTVINPITDNNGKIVEYIAVRTDITELELLKEQLSKDLNISNENFSEAYMASLSYQNAIDESNILSRTDTCGRITYVNQQFCDISGYKKEELIGQFHSIVKHPDNPKKLYVDLWSKITCGKTWKGQFKNISKYGRVYYVNSTIMPIMDKYKNIIEYLAIRHDVTDTVNLQTELENTQKEIINKMGEIGESRSKETGLHVKRVAKYSRELALLSGLCEEDANLLYAASPMHDIGKVGVPDYILQKPGPLDDDEWIIMKAHSEAGYNILKDSNRPILKAAAIVSHTHHEKWDGSGYPNTLSGDNIHIFGRITAIVDVFDALGSDRVYKKAWELEKILEFFSREKAKHFDPELVDVFLNNIDRFLSIREKYKD